MARHIGKYKLGNAQWSSHYKAELADILDAKFPPSEPASSTVKNRVAQRSPQQNHPFIMIAVDTGYFLALLNQDDAHHTQALAWLGSAQEEGWITTWPVVTEAAYLIGRRLGESAKQDFVEDMVNSSIVLWDIPKEQVRKIPALMKKYSQLPMDLADASLVLLAEHLGHGRILTTDQRDFGTYRFKNKKPFVNVMGQQRVAG